MLMEVAEAIVYLIAVAVALGAALGLAVRIFQAVSGIHFGE